ncbi:hypothetical protein [Amycolatopsis sp. cmx-4-54]|uniref:hypothetical protein n=1 Tax=Amycolatopsis sp. cmx-4-54 TaxID=2790936 RepID=UPI00397D7287
MFSEDFGPALAEAIDDTSELLVTGMARNTLVNNSYGRLEERLRAGAKIRFVLIDPRSPAIGTAASRYYAVRSPESARERVLHTLLVLAELHRSTGGDLTVRLVAHPVATGVIATGSALFAEYYTYQAAGEPKFVLQPSDGAAYRTFLDEAEALWNSATPHDLTVDDVETAGN